MGLIEVLGLFRIGMATWSDVSDAVKALKYDGISDEMIQGLREAGQVSSDALDESIRNRELREGED